MRPLAFSIEDFRSIIQSHECRLSGDGITVLAGQNESGKTAILTALRDYDLEEGEVPETEDYQPEDRPEARPRVNVDFSFDFDRIWPEVEEEGKSLPSWVINALRHRRSIRVTRDLKEAAFHLDDDLAAIWTASEEAPPPSDDATAVLSADNLATILRQHWPTFVYFDAFEGSLPRRVAVAALAAVMGGESLKPAKGFRSRFSISWLSPRSTSRRSPPSLKMTNSWETTCTSGRLRLQAIS